MAEVKFSPNVGTRQGNEKRLPEGRGKGRKKPESQKARTDRKEGDDTGVLEPGKTCFHINITELGSIYTFALDFIVDSPYFLRVC